MRSEEEKIDQDAFDRGHHGIPFQHDLEDKSDIELAELRASFRPGSPGLVIVENEWRRRDKLEQHKLNEKIIEKQHELNLQITKIQSRKTFWTSLLVAIIGISGVVIGVILTDILHRSREPAPQRIILQTPSNFLPVSPEQNMEEGLRDASTDQNKKAKDVPLQSPKEKN